MLAGLGVGPFTVPTTSAMVGAVPAERRGVANGMLGTARSAAWCSELDWRGAVFATCSSPGSTGCCSRDEPLNGRGGATPSQGLGYTE
jgi:hypothetical protein